MCGISGFIDFTNQSSKELLIKSTDALLHRGPDSSGYYFQQFEEFQIGLGHRRLSIIDLSDYAQQPMSFQHLKIVFNGEIYNYLEIREKLKLYGYTFETNSDTEVIIKSFHKWGVNCVKEFIGMFSFVVFDDTSQKMFFIILYICNEKSLLIMNKKDIESILLANWHFTMCKIQCNDFEKTELARKYLVSRIRKTLLDRIYEKSVSSKVFSFIF